MTAEKPHKNKTRITGPLLILAASVALAACSKDFSDLEQQRDEILARQGGPIEPLPQIKPYEGFTYLASDQRSPFVPDTEAARGVPGSGDLQPDMTRKREFLEDLPLDSLRMVGTLQMRGELVGLVQDPDGLIHQVRLGNYAGQNYGRIISVNDSEIRLVEIISDGLGGWIERPAAIALSE